LQKALNIQQDSDVLLLLLWDDPREFGVYSGKLFEYLASRRRILMLGFAEGVAADLLRERGAGIVANDAVALNKVLRSWVAEKRSGNWSHNDSSVAAGLDRDSQAELLRDLIEWAAD
jgi:hypothetical protein